MFGIIHHDMVIFLMYIKVEYTLTSILMLCINQIKKRSLESYVIEIIQCTISNVYGPTTLYLQFPTKEINQGV